DGAIDGMVRGQLEEHAGRWPALVELPGRMQEARAVARRRRTTGRSERGADPGDALVDRRRRRDERLDGEIARDLEARERRAEDLREGVVVVGAELDGAGSRRAAVR